MKNLKWLILFLIFLSIGCFLTAAHADGQNKNVPSKPGRAKPSPTLGNTTTGPTLDNTTTGPTLDNTTTGRSIHGHQKKNIPQDGYRKGHRGYVQHFSGHNYKHWDKQERAIWRGGEWRHDKYMGMFGWWWITGGMLYFYEEPEYPYPQSVSDVEYEIPVEDQLPQDNNQEPPEDPYYYWYYCKDPRGYYPYIPECPGGWITVEPLMQPPDQ